MTVATSSTSENRPNFHAEKSNSLKIPSSFPFITAAYQLHIHTLAAGYAVVDEVLESFVPGATAPKNLPPLSGRCLD